ncbi:helix-turn-helix domain-containing protein [Lactococcus allomyrinae]|nr:helix-turn-helix domain-containing protein [Lactococcus allomyrinae]
MKQYKIDKILNHLKEQKTITSLEAFQLYNITRLSAIIYVLRHTHHLYITNDDFKAKDGTHFARYHLHEGESAPDVTVAKGQMSIKDFM